MAENAEKSKQSQEQPLADDKITIARAKQIEKDPVDLYGFQTFSKTHYRIWTVSCNHQANKSLLMMMMMMMMMMTTTM